MTKKDRTIGITLRERYPEEFGTREAAVLAAGEYLAGVFRDGPLDLSAVIDRCDPKAGLPELAGRTFRYSFREGASTLLPDLGVLGRLIRAAVFFRLRDDDGAPVSDSTPMGHAEEPVRVSNARDIALPDGTSALTFDFQATLYLRGSASLDTHSKGGPEQNDLRVRGTGTLVGSECLLVPESMTVRV